MTVLIDIFWTCQAIQIQTKLGIERFKLFDQLVGNIGKCVGPPHHICERGNANDHGDRRFDMFQQTSFA